MTQILNFSTNQTKSNISLLPNLFTNLIQAYKKHQDDIRNKKIAFLEEQAYNHFYTLYSVFGNDALEIPGFVHDSQAKRCARECAVRAVLDVIAENRLDECYTRRVRELRQAAKEMRK